MSTAIQKSVCAAAVCAYVICFPILAFLCACLCNIFSFNNISICQSTGETEPGISNTEEDELNLVVDLEDSELCDILEANLELPTPK